MAESCGTARFLVILCGVPENSQVHVENVPELRRSPVELFLDMEDVPDRDSRYLTGLHVCSGSEAEAFWAHGAVGEMAMWSALLDQLAIFLGSAVFHYGNDKMKLFATLTKRQGSGVGLGDLTILQRRFQRPAGAPLVCKQTIPKPASGSFRKRLTHTNVVTIQLYHTWDSMQDPRCEDCYVAARRHSTNATLLTVQNG